MTKPRKKATGVAKRPRHLKADARYKQIKKYVNFKFRDDDYTARKIREIYNELWPLIHQPHTDFVPRGNSQKSIALAGVGLRQRKSFKKVPVPTAGVEGTKIKIKKGKLVAESDFLTQEIISFDKRALARRGADYVNGLVQNHGRNDLFKIQTGNYEINVAYNRDLVAAEVAKLQIKYQVGNVVPGRGKIKRGQDYKAWLNGLVRFEVKNQKSVEKVRARISQREKLKKASYKANKKKRVK